MRKRGKWKRGGQKLSWACSRRDGGKEKKKAFATLMSRKASSAGEKSSPENAEDKDLSEGARLVPP